MNENISIQAKVYIHIRHIRKMPIKKFHDILQDHESLYVLHNFQVNAFKKFAKESNIKLKHDKSQFVTKSETKELCKNMKFTWTDPKIFSFKNIKQWANFETSIFKGPLPNEICNKILLGRTIQNYTFIAHDSDSVVVQVALTDKLKEGISWFTNSDIIFNNNAVNLKSEFKFLDLQVLDSLNFVKFVDERYTIKSSNLNYFIDALSILAKTNFIQIKGNSKYHKNYAVLKIMKF